MKKISLVLFSLLMIFSINNVYADEKLPGVIGDINSYPPSDVNSSALINRIPLVDYHNTFVGVRISFVDSSGNLIAYRDYSDSKITRYSKVFATTSNYVKTSYLLNGVKPSFSTFSSNSLYDNFSSLESLLAANNFKVPDFGNSIKNIKVVDLSIFENLFSSDNHKSVDTYAKDLKNVLRYFVPENYLEGEEIQNLFMVVEPTAIFLLNNRLFYGTAYELVVQATILGGDPSTNYYSKCKKDGRNATCDFGDVLQHNLACSAYLNGNLIGQVESDKFSNNKYFGTVEIKTSIAERNCLSATDSAEFKHSAISTNYGIAMGVVWFYDYLQDARQNPTCPLIHSATDNSSIAVGDLPCEEVDNIVSSFKSTEISSEYKEIDSEWYKSECKCKKDIPANSYDCDPVINYGTCGSSQIKYNDWNSSVGSSNEFWNNCVFNEGYHTTNPYKSSDKTQTYTYYDSNLSSLNGLPNPYCSVYCTETLNTNFQSTVTALAGTKITWPTGSSITGSRTCKLKIEEDSWKNYQNDLANSINSIITNYNDYSYNKAKYDTLVNNYTKTNETCGSCVKEDYKTAVCYVMDAQELEVLGITEEQIDTIKINSNTVSLCNVETVNNKEKVTHKDLYDNQGKEVQKGYYVYNDTVYNGYKYYSDYRSTNQYTLTLTINTGQVDENNNIIYEEKKITAEQYNYYLEKCVEWNYNYVYNKNAKNYSSSNELYYSYSLNNKDIEIGKELYNIPADRLSISNYNYSDLKPTICSDDYDTAKDNAYRDYKNAERAYDAAQRTAAGYVNKMQSCYTWADESNKNSIYNAGAVLKLGDVDTGYYIEDEQKLLESSSVSEFEEPEINCKENTDYYYVCDDNGCELKTETVNNCVLTEEDKTNEVISNVSATHTITTIYSLNEDLYRYVQKMDNLSVSHIPTGSYIDIGEGNIPIAFGMPDGIYNISFEYNKLGHVTKNGTAAVDAIMKSYNSSRYGTWSCSYYLKSNLITDSEDSNNSGINVIYRTIDLKNPFPGMDGQGRKVGSNWCDGSDCSNDNNLVTSIIKQDVMSGEPMYSFTLTPLDIMNIRRYNNSEDEYGNKRSYTDFNLECMTDKGTACVSSFLTELIDRLGSNKAKGKCITNDNRLFSEQTFYSCEP